MLSMKVFIFSLVLCGVFCEDAPEITEEEKVLVLTEKNFEHAVKHHKHILVEFCK